MLTPRDARTRITRILKSLDLRTSPSNRRVDGKVLTEVWPGSENADRLAAVVREMYPRATVTVGPDPRPDVYSPIVEIRWS